MSPDTHHMCDRNNLFITPKVWSIASKTTSCHWHIEVVVVVVVEVAGDDDDDVLEEVALFVSYRPSHGIFSPSHPSSDHVFRA